jgi:Sec-independent protein translocase protein TatA
MNPVTDGIKAGESLAAHNDRTVFIVFIVVLLVIGAGVLQIMIRYFVKTIEKLADEAKVEREACTQERIVRTAKMEELHGQRQAENKAMVESVVCNTEVLRRVITILDRR